MLNDVIIGLLFVWILFSGNGNGDGGGGGGGDNDKIFKYLS